MNIHKNKKIPPFTSSDIGNEANQLIRRRSKVMSSSGAMFFASAQSDSAAALELTAKYVSYLDETLPPDVVSEFSKTVENKKTWKKTKKPPKKRRTIRLKRNTIRKPDPNNLANAWRQIRPKPFDRVNQPSMETADYLFEEPVMSHPGINLSAVHPPPILLDKSSVPRGQMLRACQGQSSTASYQSVENNWMNPPSVFPSPSVSQFTTWMLSQAVPQRARTEPVATRGPVYAPPCHQTSMVNVMLPSSGIGQVRPGLVAAGEGTTPVLVAPAAHVADEPLDPLLMLERATESSDLMAEGPDQPPPSDASCELRPQQQGDRGASSPMSASLQDTISPLWLDMLLDSSENLSIPDAIFENVVQSPARESRTSYRAESVRCSADTFCISD